MLEWLAHCFLKVFEGYHNSWNFQAEFLLYTEPKVNQKSLNGADDAYGYGRWLEWSVNCFLEALEGNLIADI